MLSKYTPVPTKKDPEPRPAIGSIWVEFNSDENVGLKQLREYMQHLVNGAFYSGIMITVKPMTGMAIRLLRGSATLSERSEERRVGKECRPRWWPFHHNKEYKRVRT